VKAARFVLGLAVREGRASARRLGAFSRGDRSPLVVSLFINQLPPVQQPCLSSADRRA
jgi:hypothetical protein